MDKNDFAAVDKFLEEMSQKGHSDVTCPKCGTPLEIEGDIRLSYAVKCQTENCLHENFRGI